jgi:uncharacterized protein (TIGR03435 family)
MAMLVWRPKAALLLTAAVIAGPVAATFLDVSRAQAQTLTEFEVASLKPFDGDTPARGMVMGGPGTITPNRITGDGVTLARLIYQAYDVPFDQISGPGWLQQDRFSVSANIPPGATKDQVKVMLQNLLAKRFGLVLHREPREFPVYELTVAQGGSKLKPTAYPDAKAARPGDYGEKPAGADGYPSMPSGISGSTGLSQNGLNRMSFQAVPISSLIFHIQSLLGAITGQNTWAPARVIDKTGLTGKYDFKLEYASSGGIGGGLHPDGALSASAASDRGLGTVNEVIGPDIFRAVTQLGLKLTKSKAAFDVLVVDRANRIPTEN